MDETVDVELPRLSDRDDLLGMLHDRGIDARPVDGDRRIGVEIPCDGDAERTCDELLAEVEGWIAERGVPLVPQRLDDRVVVHPPAS